MDGEMDRQMDGGAKAHSSRRSARGCCLQGHSASGELLEDSKRQQQSLVT